MADQMSFRNETWSIEVPKNPNIFAKLLLHESINGPLVITSNQSQRILSRSQVTLFVCVFFLHCRWNCRAREVNFKS